ncbi:hypothetical protein [Paenibacillus pini]|uniref:Uncharacterized protein n=2 Tax=Paenibacillus TaxID=44249 RepID=W7YJ39_9BACL|nr:hypothetical protein JCM16418_5165 [Paenibacillus pini JCM 16418]
MKKCFMLLFSCLLMFSLFSATVGATPVQTHYLEEIKIIQDNLIKNLEQADVNNTKEANQAIDSYFRNNPVDGTLLTDYFVNTNQKTVLPETASDSNLDLKSYLRTNIENGNFEQHIISDNVKITLTNSPFFIVETITSDEQVIDNASAQSSYMAKLAASQATPTKTYTLDVKSIIGNTIFSISVQGYFTYNGTAVNPHLVDAWYNRGTLSIWQVDDWEEGVTYEMTGKVRIYGKGKFHFGLEIAGYGLTVQDKFYNVFQEGDKNGGVLWDRTVN